jgi:hypothetical protein
VEGKTLKQLLKDAAAFAAVTTFLAAFGSFATGSNLISHTLVEIAVPICRSIAEWIDSLTILGIGATIFWLWVGASVLAYVIDVRSPRHSATSAALMFGSCATTVVALGILLFAGIRI